MLPPYLRLKSESIPSFSFRFGCDNRQISETHVEAQEKKGTEKRLERHLTFHACHCVIILYFLIQ